MPTETPAPPASTASSEIEEAPPPPAHVAPTSFALCDRAQTNAPCVFRKGDACLLRRSNCEHLPCTESAPEPHACPDA
ncbi:MAG TPA: hypothetical protein VF316_05745, partial [Polyangiaceae bacterium]